MTRQRLLVETSEQAKSALLAAVQTQGVSLADWFEEQIATSVLTQSNATPPQQVETLDPEAFNHPANILSSLATQDWAFTEDDTRYLTHDLHPYPAKFIPQIPANLITRLSIRGDVVLDPFGGSATTAVEAVRMGRRAISLDANPLSGLIGRVKTGYMTTAVKASLDRLVAAVECHAMSSSATSSEWSSQLLEKHVKYVPEIPNLEKWFSAVSSGELALLRHLIDETTEGLSRDAALLALSRIVLRASYQESETRYVAVAKVIHPTLILRAYLESLRTVMRRLETASVKLQYADVRFITGDGRVDLLDAIGEGVADLIVTSPPYPNATDYHLYHRFRLFWLGYDPRKLGEIEIGSHLRHQRNGTGFEEYMADMQGVMSSCFTVLAAGRYAVFVVGDALFKGQVFSTSEALRDLGAKAGFEDVGRIDRPIHQQKRSFAKAGRRARSESLVVFRKPDHPVLVKLNPPGYKMWAYEAQLRLREIEKLTSATLAKRHSFNPIQVTLRQSELWHARRLAFTSDFELGRVRHQTWQRVLENGDAHLARRKDPKYATHGLHPYKGKFYPQLAKALLNLSGAPLGGRVVDPFCGSGTTLVEGMLNGFRAYGADLNPLAAKISRAKTAVLFLPREIVDLAIRSLLDRVRNYNHLAVCSLEQFPPSTHGELQRWFPSAVLTKLNWLLSQIRLYGHPDLVDYFEVIASSIIREVSQQDPLDLRVRRRKSPIEDAPVIEMYHDELSKHYLKLQKYWAVAGRQPGSIMRPTVLAADSRKAATFRALDLTPGTVDCVLTSPPYATALPYLDTDRLSLLAIMGISAPARGDIELDLTGSREISRVRRLQLETELKSHAAKRTLPSRVVKAIQHIYEANTTTAVGFRRANMAALLWRYFQDMAENLGQTAELLRPGASAIYVVGDSRTKAGGEWTPIRTCKHIAEIGESKGLKVAYTLPIDVTTDNHKHAKNAITENEVIVFRKT